MLVLFFLLILMLPQMAEAKITGLLGFGINSASLVQPGFIAHNHPYGWGSIRLMKDGWYWNNWGSVGFENHLDDAGEEFDATLGKVMEIQGVTVDMSGSYFVLAPFKDGGNDVWIFDARADFPEKIPWITPWMAFRYFGRVGKESVGGQGGWFAWVGAERLQLLGFTLPYQKDELALRINALSAFSLGGAFHGKAGLVYVRLSGSSKLSLGDVAFLVPQIVWQQPIQSAGSYVDGDDHLIFNISIFAPFSF